MGRDGVELVVGKDQVAEVSQTLEMIILVGMESEESREMRRLSNLITPSLSLINHANPLSKKSISAESC